MSSVLHKVNSWTFAQIEIGQSWEIERTFTAQDSDEFARLSGDFNPLHVDSEYARSTEFEGRVIHGMLLASLFSQLVGMWLPGKYALYLGQDLSFRRPVLVGQTVRAFAKVVSKNVATRALTLATEIRHSDGKVAVSGTAKVKLRDAQPMPAEIGGNGWQAAEHRSCALVTGGSRGVGAEIAKKLAARGTAVAVNYFQNTESANSVVS